MKLQNALNVPLRFQVTVPSGYTFATASGKECTPLTRFARSKSGTQILVNSGLSDALTVVESAQLSEVTFHANRGSFQDMDIVTKIPAVLD